MKNLKQVYEMFTDAWRFARKWLTMQEQLTQQQFDELVDEASRQAEKYGEPGSKAFMAALLIIEKENAR